MDRPPLPLLHGVDIVEQPTDLNKLSQRYVDFALSFIRNATQAQKPWLLYYAFNHVHVPDFASQPFCNTSIRGRFGDALAELDDAVGQVCVCECAVHVNVRVRVCMCVSRPCESLCTYVCLSRCVRARKRAVGGR